MKKYLFLILTFLVFLVGCNSQKESGNLVLKIYNWQDYIDDGKDDNGNDVEGVNSVIVDWTIDYEKRTGKKVEVIYDTFETNEVMLNTLKTGKTNYDLVCPSEYAIQKMIRENMLEKYDFQDGILSSVENYNLYTSPYLKRIFLENELVEYAVPYMWGTLGIIYNPEKVKEEDVKTWSVLWNKHYINDVSVKDSVRDTFVCGVMYLNHDKLMKLRADYESGLISASEYNKQVSLIMNDTSDLKSVEKVLKELKQNIFGFEVDSGKNDIATGKIAMNVAWSGDAVYSMNIAEEEEEVYLNYCVPEEGGNIWFDGWVMPKGANKELAQDFVNFLCSPKIAARNMSYIGYTTSTAGDEIFELINELYGVDDGEDGEAADLSYFFGDTLSEEYLEDGKAIVYVSERGRQFDAQFPSEEVITRCAIMEDFKEMNNDVLAMWEHVKLGDYSIWLTIGVLSFIAVVLGMFYYLKISKKIKKKRKKLNW